MENKKRPILVWISSLYFIVGVPIGLLAIFYTLNDEPDIFARFNAFDMSLSWLTMIINFVGGIQLFRLRVQALWLFLAAIAIAFIPTILRLFSGGLGEYYEGFELSTLFSFAIWGAFLFYLFQLRKNKVLV
jgi:hypothetical protein